MKNFKVGIILCLNHKNKKAVVHKKRKNNRDNLMTDFGILKGVRKGLVNKIILNKLHDITNKAKNSKL